MSKKDFNNKIFTTCAIDKPRCLGLFSINSIMCMFPKNVLSQKVDLFPRLRSIRYRRSLFTLALTIERNICLS